MSQTLTLSIDNSTQTNDLVTNSVEKGIFKSKDIGANLLNEIVKKCHTMELNVKVCINLINIIRSESHVFFNICVVDRCGSTIFSLNGDFTPFIFFHNIKIGTIFFSVF